jgi:hypothetical protein
MPFSIKYLFQSNTFFNQIPFSIKYLFQSDTFFQSNAFFNQIHFFNQIPFSIKYLSKDETVLIERSHLRFKVAPEQLGRLGVGLHDRVDGHGQVWHKKEGFDL